MYIDVDRFTCNIFISKPEKQTITKTKRLPVWKTEQQQNCLSFYSKLRRSCSLYWSGVTNGIESANPSKWT